MLLKASCISAGGIEMKVVPATVVNLKITYKHDMDAFLKMASTYFFDDIIDE